MVCPRCGSRDIEVELDDEGIAYFEECFSCGYVNVETECKSKFARGGLIKKNSRDGVPVIIKTCEYLITAASLRKLRLHNK